MPLRSKMPAFCAKVIGAKPVHPLIASVTLGTSAQAELVTEAIENTAPSVAAANTPVHRLAIHHLAIVRPSCRLSFAALVYCLARCDSTIPSLSQRPIAANSDLGP